MSTPWDITIYGTDGNPARIAGSAVGQPPGGATPTLAEVLAEGGDPDGNPVTGPLEVAPSSAVADSALSINMPADTEGNYPYAIKVTSEDLGDTFWLDQYGDCQIRLDPDGGAQFWVDCRGIGGPRPLQVGAALGGTVNQVQVGGTAADLLSFYGNAGVARPVVPLTTPGVQDVIDALVALGLVSQSD